MAHLTQQRHQPATVNQQSSAFKIRKANKPLMEKKRRERINRCLTELKSLVLEATRKSNTHYSKLEKADILELTVKYLRTVQRDQMTRAALVDPTVMTRYRLGFTECAAEVARYVSSGSPIIGNPKMEVDEQGGNRLVEHISNCKVGLDAAASSSLLIVDQKCQSAASEGGAASVPISSPQQQGDLIATLAQCLLASQQQQQMLSAFTLVSGANNTKQESSTPVSSPSPSSPVPVDLMTTPSTSQGPSDHHSPLTPSPSSAGSSSICLTTSPPPSTLKASPVSLSSSSSSVWRPW